MHVEEIKTKKQIPTRIGTLQMSPARVWGFHKSYNLILIGKYTYPYFLSRVVMYLFYKNDSGDRETII